MSSSGFHHLVCIELSQLQIMPGACISSFEMGVMRGPKSGNLHGAGIYSVRAAPLVDRGNKPVGRETKAHVSGGSKQRWLRLQIYALFEAFHRIRGKREGGRGVGSFARTWNSKPARGWMDGE